LRTAVVFIVLALFLTSPVIVSQEDEDGHWMRQNAPAVFASLIQLKPESGQYVTYYTYRTPFANQPEYYFRLGNDRNTDGSGLQSLSAHSRAADGASLQDQILQLHQQNPGDTPAVIASKLKIEKIDVSEKVCPAIRARFEAFKRLSLQIPKFDTVVFDPRVHEFRIQTGAGDMQLSLTDEKTSIVVWALKTRQVIEECGGKQKS